MISLNSAFLATMIYPDDKKKEEAKYVERVKKAAEEDSNIEIYDKNDSKANCRRICKSNSNFLYWILPIWSIKYS